MKQAKDMTVECGALVEKKKQDGESKPKSRRGGMQVPEEKQIKNDNLCMSVSGSSGISRA